MKKIMRKFKQGAASFYIVVFSTLILVIIAASFAMVIISAVTRTSNDDLSQSAYDSALAGVEDAKLAYSNYLRCIEQYPYLRVDELENVDGPLTCKDIIYYAQHPDCAQVAHILGRVSKSVTWPYDAKDENGNTKNIEVPVGEVDGEYREEGNSDKSKLQQAYTCAMFSVTVDDYRSSLTSSEGVKMVKVNFGCEAATADSTNCKQIFASDIAKVRISWFSNRTDLSYNYLNFVGNNVRFKAATTNLTPTPPTLEVQMIQTAASYTLADFDKSVGNTTDRATMYFVPGKENVVEYGYKGGTATYNGVWNKTLGDNVITAAQIASTNNREKNVPFGVACPQDDREFACSVLLELPDPVVSNAYMPERNDDTFMFLLSLPYKQPDTDFQIEFCTRNGECKSMTDTASGDSSVVQLTETQVVIDSTGRANDLYRRVEARLEQTGSDTVFPYPYYAIQVLGDKDSTNSDDLLTKDLTITTEYGL